MLRNPAYFVLLFVFGVGAYVVYTLNLATPLYQMANAASAPAIEEGRRRLLEFLQSSETGRQAVAMSTGNDSYEMRNVTRTSTKAKVDGADDEDADEI